MRQCVDNTDGKITLGRYRFCTGHEPALRDFPNDGVRVGAAGVNADGEVQSRRA